MAKKANKKAKKKQPAEEVPASASAAPDGREAGPPPR